jgi:phosphohistidine phosphatase SixA
MVVKIFFFRHSYVDGPEETDPLTADGRKRAEEVGAKHLTGVVLDQVVVSHCLRTRETVDCLARGAGRDFCPPGVGLVVEPLLFSFNPDLRVKLEERFAQLPGTATVLVVGHGGILNELVQDLTNEEKERVFLPCFGVLVELLDGKYMVVEELRR